MRRVSQRKKTPTLPFRITANKPEPRDRQVKGQKFYAAHDDPEKLRINRLFARNVVNFLGLTPRVIILDTAEAITSKILVAAGIRKSLITAPNLNVHDSLRLRAYGVHDFIGNIETVVQLTSFDAGWYDSMTTMNGRVDVQSYIGLFVHRFLIRNRGKRCVLAVTVNTQSSTTSCNGLPQKKMFKRQVAALIAYHGFVAKKRIIDPYKKSHVFGMWNLVPAPTGPQRVELLCHEDGHRLVGFPPGFTHYDL